MYQCSLARDFVVSRIQSVRFHLHPAQLISLSIKYHTRALFLPAFEQLIDIPIIQLTAQRRELLGVTVFTSLVYLQAALD